MSAENCNRRDTNCVCQLPVQRDAQGHLILETQGSFVGLTKLLVGTCGVDQTKDKGSA